MAGRVCGAVGAGKLNISRHFVFLTDIRSLMDLFQNDYRMVAIDVRGFGGSSHPSDIQSSSTMADITGDLACVLEHAKVTSAICLGYAPPSAYRLI